MKIPKTADQAVEALASAGALVTAKEWERAAIVAALVGPALGKGGDRRSTNRSSAIGLTTTDLAAKGIVGLRSTNTVERYRDAWESTGRPFPALGDTVDLDGLPDWPPTRTGTDGYSSEEGAAKTIKRIVAQHGPEVIAEAAAAPEVRKATKQAIDRAELKELGEAVDRAGGDGRIATGEMPMETWEVELWMEAEAIAQRIADVRRRVQRLHARCEPDQWTKCADHMEKELGRLLSAVTGATTDFDAEEVV